MDLRRLVYFALSLLFVLPYAASQTTASSLAASAPTAVPPLVPYSGLVDLANGPPRVGQTSITFLIYKDEEGGQPLFTETQTVALDLTGHYKVELGAANPNGLPLELFSTGEARWLEVQIAGGKSQPRVLLASVPYAMKAADAATLGGLPASAFALAGSRIAVNGVPSGGTAAGAVADANLAVTTPGGTTGYLPRFSGANTILNSEIFDTGTSVGIGRQPNPSAILDVNGATILRGGVQLSRTGNATPAAGTRSFPFGFYTQAYNSATKAIVNPLFEWLAEPTGNNTASPSATMNLLFSNGTPLAETGLFFNRNGTIHFASGQTFPGGAITGNLSVSGTASAGTVNAATALDLGGALFAVGSQETGNVSLGFAGNSSTTGNSNLAIGIDALFFNTTGSNNTASGSYALEGNTTGDNNTASGLSALSSNTSGNDNSAAGKNALYSNTTGTENTASGSGAVFSNTTGSGNTASGYQALSSNITGGANTASGDSALFVNTTGFYNAASGYQALYSNTTGFSNTASGSQALLDNTVGDGNVGVGFGAGDIADLSGGTGSHNTAVGYNALFGTGALTNATAIGANAEVDRSNTLVLGCVTGVNGCPTAVSVGIGTTTPDNLLTVNGSADKPGGGSWGTYSDGRLKTVNGGFGSGLGQVMQLRPIRYRYKPDNALGIRDADEHIGVVAQEVQRVIPEAVTENGRGYLLVNNDPILWSMVNAIKEQQREIDEQRRLLRAQGAAMRSLAAEIRETRKTLRQVRAQAKNPGLKIETLRLAQGRLGAPALCLWRRSRY